MVKIIDDFKRREAIRNITGNQGFVIETEDKIICYIQKEKCIKEEHYASMPTYCIRCTDYKEEYKKLVEEYNLDKKVVYVLDGLVFNEYVRIKGGVCDLEIRNCNFNRNLEIRVFGNCIIKNTHISPKVTHGEVFVGAQKVLVDGSSISSFSDPAQPHFIDWGKLCICATNLLDVKNSKIGIGHITLVGGKCMDVTNSLFRAYDISISSERINSILSQLVANHKLEVKTESFEGLMVKTPLIFFNGVPLLNHKDSSKFYSLQPTNEEQNYWRAIIEQLKGIKDNLDEEKQKILDSLSSEIDEKSITSRHIR